jgi:riboflavin synthase
MIFLDFCRASHKPLFTGIIEDLGTVEAIRCADKCALLTIRTRLPIGRIRIGDSIAVSGACLTVTAKGRGMIAMDVSAETLRRTALGQLKPGDRVNLERCLTLAKLVGGHLVAGHVDGVGRLVSVKPEGDSRLLTFEAPAGESRYLVEKGSVAVDGVSLTVFGVRGARFTCALIPHTLKKTTLGLKRPGAPINFESDLLGKYVEKLIARPGGNGAVSRVSRKMTGEGASRGEQP